MKYGSKIPNLPDCQMCDGRWQAIFFRTYQHPNGERYSVHVCVFCANKNKEWEVQ
jgi:hypothetical protein